MENQSLLSEETISNKIYFIRRQKVMLDRDLALLYGIETKRLKEQVKRNISRFPEDFMFELNKKEFENWRSQFATSNSDKISLIQFKNHLKIQESISIYPDSNLNFTFA